MSCMNPAATARIFQSESKVRLSPARLGRSIDCDELLNYVNHICGCNQFFRLASSLFAGMLVAGPHILASKPCCWLSPR
jgi:hypothetical protein